LQTTEQVSIVPETVSSYVRISPIVLCTGNAESVAQTVELLGIDCVDGQSTIKQCIDHGAVWNLDTDSDKPALIRD
jgi:hypothetical protein